VNALKGGVLLLALVAAAVLAAAQDPSVNESDFDTTAPEPDESYLDEASGEPTVAQDDFDTSVPPADESYLADGAAGTADDEAEHGGHDTPGFGASALALALVAAALVARDATRRAREP
jgi:hypothetical protein